MKPGLAGDSGWTTSCGTFLRAPRTAGRDTGKNPCSSTCLTSAGYEMTLEPVWCLEDWGRLGQGWQQSCPLWGHHRGLELGIKPPPHHFGIQQILKAELFGGCWTRQAGKGQSGDQGSIHPARMLWLRIQPEGFCGGEDQEYFPKTLLSSRGQWRACQILSRHINVASSK